MALEAVQERRYAEALSEFDAALAGAAAKSRARIMAALHEAGSGAMAAGDYESAVEFLVRLAPDYERYTEARETMALASDLLFRRMVTALSLHLGLPVSGDSCFEVSLDGVGRVVLTVTGLEPGGGLTASLSWVGPGGTRSVFPRNLCVHWSGPFPAQILPDGRVLVEGVTLWRPPDPPVALCPAVLSAEVEGWAVDSWAERVAVALLVDRAGTRTLEVVVCSLVTGECETIDSYVPGPPYPVGSPIQPVSMGWDNLVLHYDRHCGDRVEVIDWTADRGLREAVDALARKAGVAPKGLLIEVIREGVGTARLRVTEEDVDGALLVLLEFSPVRGEYVGYPGLLRVYPYDAEPLPVHLLADGRLIVSGGLWDPADPSASGWPEISGTIVGWAVDPRERWLAAVFFVNRGDQVTLDTAVLDLETEVPAVAVIDSYAPGPVWPPDWMGCIVSVVWQGSTLRFQRYTSERIEIGEWTAPGP